MRAVSDVMPPIWLMGDDRYEEMWEGVLHLVPQPARWHQRFASELLVILGRLDAQGVHGDILGRRRESDHKRAHSESKQAPAGAVDDGLVR